MGTSGDPNDDTRYFSQADRQFLDQRQAEFDEYWARRRWGSIILSCTIIAIAGAVMALMVWGGR